MATGTPNLKEAVDKACSRADDLSENLNALARRVRDRHPDDIAPEAQKRARRRFLESLYDEENEAKVAFERIIGGNELQDANFLSRGALVMRAVLRIVIRSAGGRVLGYGTGMLIGDGVLMTNNHVLPSSDVARASYAEAFYEKGLMGEDAPALAFQLLPDKVWYTSKPLDFTIVGVAETDRGGSTKLGSIGWIPLIGQLGKAVEGEWLNIVQHPKGERKQLCVRENQLLKCDTDVLWYSTDTLGGSSGSPVFNNDWLIVALHHSGVPETRDGKWQTIDGRDYDENRDGEDKIRWVANEGIRVSRILETLRTDNSIANHRLVDPLLKTSVGDIQVRLPILFPEGHTPPDLIAAARTMASGRPTDRPTPPEEARMTKRLVTVTLEIDDDGSVSVADQQAREADLLVETRSSSSSLEIDAPVEPENDWEGGYAADFLGTDVPEVDLPSFADRASAPIAPLLLKSVYGRPAPDQQTAESGILRYGNYSVVMNKDRRVAFFSAANIDGGVQFKLKRPPDRWLYDDRIDRKHQIGNSFYANNKIDRGHLTRREDMEWGTDPVVATRRANGTNTWTNCSPQHKLFNQDKHPDPQIRLWQALEQYILEQQAREYRFKVQAFTGPIFSDDDPEYRGVKIPLQYWKVVVAVDAKGDLFATGYVLSQSDVLDVTNLDEAAIEAPFGKFQTYQRPLREIEEATSLQFTYGQGKSLNDVDPLAKELDKPAWQRRRRRPGGSGAQESFVPAVTADGALESLDDILLA